MTTYPMPVVADEELATATTHLEDAGIRLVGGTVVDPAGVIRAKHVPARRAGAFHAHGMGASPSWNVFCVDNAIAFTPRFGVVGDMRLRADLTGLRVLGAGLAWAPAEMFDQDAAPAPVCTRGLLRCTAARPAEQDLAARVGCELEMVLTPRNGPGWTRTGRDRRAGPPRHRAGRRLRHVDGRPGCAGERRGPGRANQVIRVAGQP